MKITDVRVDGFGVWRELNLENLSERVTVFFGPNEAGKTTLMQFVRTVLYGFSEQRRERYLPPLHGGNPGGSLQLTVPSGDYVVSRSAPAPTDRDGVGFMSIAARDGTTQGEHVLAAMLGGIDEAIFNNVFAIGLREIQELSTLNDTAAADQLYKMTSGMDRVSIVDVMRDLQRSRKKLLSPEGEGGELLDLIEKRERLMHQVEEAGRKGTKWTRLAVERERVEQQTAQLQASIEQLEREARLVETAMQVHDKWNDRIRLDQRLSRISPVELPDNALEELGEIAEAEKARETRYEELQKQRTAIREEAAIQPLNALLRDNQARVEAITEHLPWIESLESQIERLRPQVREMELRLNAQCDELGISSQSLSQHSASVNSKTLIALKAPARSVRESSQRLREAEEDAESSLQDVAKYTDQLEQALAHSPHADLSDALDAAGQRVTQLRRRIQLEERLEKMKRHEKELEEDVIDLMETQVMPIGKLMWLGVPFVLGVMMILGGLFWSQSAVFGWPVALLGLAGLCVGVVMKFMLENSTDQELDECEQQQEILKKQMRQAKEERDDLDRELPRGGGQLEHRLAKAQEELEALEQLVPIDGERKASYQRHEAAQHRVEQATEALKEARDRWKVALRRFQLPETLTPKVLKQMAQGNQQVHEVRKSLELQRDELDRREQELASITNRIDQLMKTVDIKPVSNDPKQKLKQLASALTDQKQVFVRRSELKKRFREVKRESMKCRHQLERLKNRRHGLLTRAGVDSEHQLRLLIEQQDEYRKLRQQRDTLNDHIASMLIPHCTEEEIGAILNSKKAKQLDQNWDALVTDLQKAQTEVSRSHQRLGELQTEMKLLAEDRQLAERQLELGCVEEQIKQAFEQWRTLAVTNYLLETIREIYESERQPETLSEASKYLERLTEGQYVRVWTPLTEDVLRVDSKDGDSLRLDVLSRGTREAVFLSLRLALVASYARRGAVLPLVLDDVLVNLDLNRAKAAMGVLRDFAKDGHQLLMFTCHEHIMKMCKSLRVEVRHLPSHLEWSAGTQTELEVEEAEEETWEEEEHEEVAEPVEETPEPEEEPEEEEIAAEDESEDWEEESDEEWEEEDEPEEELEEEEYEPEEVLEDDEYEDEELEDEDEEDEYEEYEENAEPYTLEAEAEVEDELEDEEVAPVEYTLAEAEEVAAVADPLLELEEDEEEEEVAEEPEEVVEELEEEEEEPPAVPKTRSEQMFTWESPEMWWDDPTARKPLRGSLKSGGRGNKRGRKRGGEAA